MVSAEPSSAANLAGPPTSPQQHELIKCICNLCQCGRHSCSSYQLPSQHPTKESPLPDNRCSNRSSSSSSRMSVEPVEQARAGSQCCCLRELAEERYLSPGSLRADLASRGPTRSVASQRSNLVASASQQHETPLPDYLDDDELMHVLISRPQVASKPRDNIIFEGDMDLRTTFESTYEALAKMRLECWKRYQEGASGGGAQVSLARKSPNNNKPSTPAQAKDDAKQVSFPPELSTNYRQEAASPGEPHPQQEQAPAQVADYLASHSDNHQASTRASSEQASAHQTVVPSAGAGYVDPDLACIMVYNSNLDRLEKVSCRRRNKHRPLTSLRPGAQGFFGNPEEEEQESSSSSSRKCEQAHQQQQQVTSTGKDQQEIGGSSLIRGQQQQQPMTASTAEDEDPQSQQQQHQLPPTGEHSIKLNGRNLTNSSQPQCSLLYSDENLPVDSKRKVRNNVNMIDHIRDQNIIESHYSGAKEASQSFAYHEPSPTQPRSPPDGKLPRQHEEQLNGLQQARSLSAADLLLARQEEAEALAEIKRLTSSSSGPPETQKTAPKPPEVAAMQLAQSAPPAAQENADSCRLRLQRTCQQQNFHISDNDYTSYLHQPSHTNPPATPQQQFDNNNRPPTTKTHPSAQYNNLFRESPDFILATTGFSGGQQDSNSSTLLMEHKLNEQFADTSQLELALEPEVDPKSDMVGHPRGTDSYLEEQREDEGPINNMCKVEELDHSYHYVGTKGGHKYFSLSK